MRNFIYWTLCAFYAVLIFLAIMVAADDARPQEPAERNNVTLAAKTKTAPKPRPKPVPEPVGC